MIKKKVVLYLRLSQEDGDGESMSIANQRKILYEYTESHNMEIVDEYVDDGITGYTMNRPEFNRLKRDLNNDKVDTILAKDLSRIGRHNAKVQLFLENIQEAGKCVIALGDNYATYDERSQEILGVQTWVNEKYIKDTSRKVRDIFATLQKEGRLLTNIPYGYYRDPLNKSKCHADKNLSIYIQQIFDMYINGKGVKEIARILTNNNVPTPSMVRKQRQSERGETSRVKVSTLWDVSVIIRILKNEFYLGTLVLNKTKTRTIHGKKISVPPEEHLKFPNHHEAIIDKQTFYLAQEIMKSRSCSHFRGIKSKVRKNIFAGVIYCADCGKPLTTSGKTSNTKYLCRTYNVFGTSKCSSHAVMENDILDAILELLEDCKNNLQDVLNDLSNIIQAELKVRSNKEDSSYDIVKRLERCKKELEVLIEQKVRETMKNPNMTDIIDKMYSDMQNEKYKEIQSLEKQIADQQNYAIKEVEMKDNINIALNIINEILTTSDITKKQVLMIIEKIMVYDDGCIDIYLKGNLHELTCNYFKVTKNKKDMIKKHLFDYIATHPDKFTKDECTVYVKEQGVMTNYKIISKIINEDLQGMVELRPMRHGYRLIKPIEEVERILINNIVTDTAECLYSNNVKYGERMESINNVVGTAEWRRNNCDIFAVLVQINAWIECVKYSKRKNLF